MDALDLEIRDAGPADLERIFAIYNVEVESGIATFDVAPKSAARDADWLTQREPIHPVLVAADGDGLVIGWAALGPWSPRGAYRRTAEVSVYVDVERRSRGIGGRLLGELIGRGRALGLGVLLARVALPNPASIALHEALGFRSFGTQRRCGEKHGRILDVELFDLHLDE